MIGLFQGMFEKNILTFNPGWDQNAQTLDTFTDVRELQRQLKADGVELMSEADENTTGPASLITILGYEIKGYRHQAAVLVRIQQKTDPH